MNLEAAPRRTTEQVVRFRSRPYRLAGAVGGALLITMLLLASIPGLFSPFDPHEQAGAPFMAPSAVHLLGTNDIGQDLFTEVIWGTRASLLTGLTVAVVAVTAGTIIGLYTGYFRNLFSTLLLRLIDLTLVLPFLPLVILLSAYLGSDQRNVIIILTLVSWAAPARVVRSRVLPMLGAPFIEASRALGSSDRRILFSHILPGVRSIVVIQFVLVTGTTILAEASLSFLGLGDPATKSWGSTLFFAQASGVFLGQAWIWWVLPAGVMITLSVLSLALISYSLEFYLEPTLR